VSTLSLIHILLWLIGVCLNAVHEHVRPMLAGIMQELLNIANESDIDELSTVMETMIEMFGEEMAPFAVTLCTQLVGPLCFSTFNLLSDSSFLFSFFKSPARLFPSHGYRGGGRG